MTYLQHPVPRAIVNTEHHPGPHISTCTEHPSGSSAASSPAPRQHPTVPCISLKGPPFDHLVIQADAASTIGAPALLQTDLHKCSTRPCPTASLMIHRRVPRRRALSLTDLSLMPLHTLTAHLRLIQKL